MRKDASIRALSVLPLWCITGQRRMSTVKVAEVTFTHTFLLSVLHERTFVLLQCLEEQVGSSGDSASSLAFGTSAGACW